VDNQQLQIHFNSQQFIEVNKHAISGDGTVDLDHIDFISERADKRLIVVAAAPRTGSTFLSNVLSQFTASPYFRLSSAYGTNENDLSLPALCFINPTGCVSQLHMKGTYHNAKLIQKFGIKPIILVRNIHDTIISLMNDLKKKREIEDYGTGKTGYSFMWQDMSTKKHDDEQLIDMIIDLAIPWYVNFYVSWHRLCEQQMIDAKWVTYEDLMKDKNQVVNDILNFVDAKQIAGNSDEILSKKYGTFNGGKIGYGAKLINNARKKRIKKLFSYYPDIKFKYYGLL